MFIKISYAWTSTSERTDVIKVLDMFKKDKTGHNYLVRGLNKKGVIELMRRSFIRKVGRPNKTLLSFCVKYDIDSKLLMDNAKKGSSINNKKDIKDIIKCNTFTDEKIKYYNDQILDLIKYVFNVSHTFYSTPVNFKEYSKEEFNIAFDDIKKRYKYYVGGMAFSLRNSISNEKIKVSKVGHNLLSHIINNHKG